MIKRSARVYAAANAAAGAAIAEFIGSDQGLSFYKNG